MSKGITHCLNVITGKEEPLGCACTPDMAQNVQMKEDYTQLTHELELFQCKVVYCQSIIHRTGNPGGDETNTAVMRLACERGLGTRRMTPMPCVMVGAHCCLH